MGKIKDGYNPATWMLEVTSIAHETALGVNFAELYKSSELYRFASTMDSHEFLSYGMCFANC